LLKLSARFGKRYVHGVGRPRDEPGDLSRALLDKIAPLDEVLKARGQFVKAPLNRCQAILVWPIIRGRLAECINHLVRQSEITPLLLSFTLQNLESRNRLRPSDEVGTFLELGSFAGYDKEHFLQYVVRLRKLRLQ